MKTAGIIAEYNPFHNGHAYHIAETRKRSGADYIVIVMSPDFVQRGEAALLDKWTRARCALEAGADLVLQLPVWSAAGSAEYFAQGGVSLLSHLGICDYLSFGCETEFPELISAAAGFFAQDNEPALYREVLRKKLKEGLTFPSARAQALEAQLLSASGPEDEFLKAPGQSLQKQEQIGRISSLLSSPNNLLAVEYQKALLRTGSTMKILPVRRKGSAHNEENLAGTCSSASSIRNLLRGLSERAVREGRTISEGLADQGLNTSDAVLPSDCIPENSLALLSACMPENSLTLLKHSLAERRLLFPDDLDLVLQMKLNELAFRQESGQADASFDAFWDVDQALANRIRNTLGDYTGFEEYASLLKGRQITQSRVRRALIHILLGIRADDAEEFRRAGSACYLRVLGFRKTSAPLLNAIKKNSDLPMITKLADAGALLCPAGRKMLDADLCAASVRAVLEARKSGGKAQNEYTRQLVII